MKKCAKGEKHYKYIYLPKTNNSKHERQIYEQRNRKKNYNNVKISIVECSSSK